ncbi:MAG TPA: CAP domain-containing protein [Candidatus Limnocylindrales bacterium]
MRFTKPSRLVIIPAAIALGFSLFAASMTWGPAPAAAGSGPLDAQSTEMVRLINGARAAQGKAPLQIDTFLAAKARDGSIPCPDDATKTIAGRTQDFATFGNMSHSLRLCNADSYTLSATSYVSVLQGWGYGSVGEINLVNGGYGSGAYLYSSGGWQTWTYATTGHAMIGWASSSSHWNIIMGGYDRVGCGGWASGSTFYYECSFSSGGPNGVVSPPTQSPFDNPLPTPTPTPTPPPAPTVAPTQRIVLTAPPVSGGGGSSSGGSTSKSTPAGTTTGTPAATSSVTLPAPVFSATSAVQGATAQGAQTAAATSGPVEAMAGVVGDGHGTGSGDGFSSLPAIVVEVIALVAGSSSAVLAAFFILMSFRRRRRAALR